MKYTIDIKAPADKVFDTMLGIQDKSTYEQWTTVFNPTSSYEGKWEKGAKMYFVATDDKGKKAGLISEIVDFIPAQFVSIRHYGMLDGEKEITEGPDVESWAGNLENYAFEDHNGITTVTVEMVSSEDHSKYYDKIFPKALNILKAVVEK